jgi:hypothetical protein
MHAQHRALDVDREDVVDRGLGDVAPGHLLAGDVADVVHQGVDAVQLFERGVGHGLDLLPVDDVGLEQHRGAACRRDPVGRPLGSVGGAAVVDADRAGALLSGAYRDLGAEAGAGAGDDNGPPLEAARYGNGCCRHGMSFLSRGQTRTRPPSTYRTWPVMKRARSDARKVTASATSSGRPSRSAGTSDSRLSRLLSLSR